MSAILILSIIGLVFLALAWVVVVAIGLGRMADEIERRRGGQ